MNPSEPVVAFSTIDSEKEAIKIAKALVEAHLAACVNVVPKVTSVYEWKEEICEEGEAFLIIQTHMDVIDELKVTIKEMHPYEVPMLLICPVSDGLDDYLSWMSTYVLRRA